jgi:hypothetical protein
MEENKHRDERPVPELPALIIIARGQLNNAYFSDSTEYTRQSLTDTMVYCALALAKLPHPGQEADPS